MAQKKTGFGDSALIAYNVARILKSLHLKGSDVDPETMAIAQRYVDGEITQNLIRAALANLLSSSATCVELFAWAAKGRRMQRAGFVKRSDFIAANTTALGTAAVTASPVSAFTVAAGGDAITDVSGVKVGHFTDTRRYTGCSVVITQAGAVGGVDVRGAAPGTRETDLLNPMNLVEKVHAVVLSGGSAFGLDSATGVMRYLEEHGIGYDVGVAKVPIVPAAILFDLAVGNAKIRPDAAAGYAAAQSASTRFPGSGNVGAGAGATVGKFFGMERAMKCGLGTASISVAGLTVGAMVAVNGIGDVIDPATGAVIAGARTVDGTRLVHTTRSVLAGELPALLRAGTATSLGIVATDAVLTKAQAEKIAQMAHDGFARTIDPVHTMYDGDTIFTLATGTAGKTANVSLLGIMAADAIARAVLRAARAAAAIAGFPAHRDIAR